MQQATIPPETKPVEKLESVVVRFAGDSGDGMQLTGSQFTNTTAIAGNDLATLPDYPAEIRAPAGTLPGVSGFQINFASSEIYTPGDAPDVLVAMNPAALKVNVADLKPNGVLIVNEDAFDAKDLRKAGYAVNPLEDDSLAAYRLIKLPLTTLTRKGLAELELATRAVDRCKNFYALGLMYWLFSRSVDGTLKWVASKFKAQPVLVAANSLALKAGYAYGEASELFHERYLVPAASLEPGTYRNITGNSAIALGLVAAAHKLGLQLFLGSYPITPASEILHELARYKNHGVITFQAEDEIAGIGSALGAAFGGSLAVTTSSGPGIALKGEAIGLATMVELPMVICNIQRGGPSTGLPTKTEQADLLQALYGRNGEAPLPVLSASSPADCFDVAVKAAELAVKYMVPVLLLSDGYLANGSEPWRLPNVENFDAPPVEHYTNPENYRPYQRDLETLARPWVVPGTKGMEHRIGGLESEDVTGNVSYDPFNHERMVKLRAEKVARIVRDVPDLVISGDADGGELLLVGWGSTLGAIQGAVGQLRAAGLSVSSVHFRHLNPLPANTAEVLGKFERVVVVEMNMGQLRQILRAEFLVDAEGMNKVQGKPFTEGELVANVKSLAKERS